jgi:nucleotide-binding universal stress UspA family protein
MRILLAIDGSRESAEAARALAHLSRAERVIVLHVLEPPWPGYPVLPEYPMLAVETARELCEAAEEQMRTEAQRLLDRIRSVLPQDLGSVSMAVETGSPAEVILKTAEAERAQLIVMGARGREAVPEMALGSVSHRVVTHAACPTLIVRTSLPSLRHVLLPVQGPEDSAAAVRYLASRPFRHPVELTVLTVLPAARSVWDETPPAVETLQTRAMDRAREFVANVASQVSALGYPASGATRTGFTVEEISRESEESGANLVLIGCRAKREASRFLLGSVAYALLHRMATPVLVFR